MLRNAASTPSHSAQCAHVSLRRCSASFPPHLLCWQKLDATFFHIVSTFNTGAALTIWCRAYAQFSVAQFRSCAAGSAASEIVQNTLEVVQMCKILWYRAVVVQLKLWCKCWMWHRATVQMLHSANASCANVAQCKC